MKRFISALLIFGMIFGLVPIIANAAGTNYTAAYQTVKATGIMVGDESGNMNLNANVTRAEFAKMMVAASIYKDTIGEGSNISPFKDVKYTHWAAEYIKTAANAGWFIGFTDGTFRPGNNITIEEAATASIRLLGYTASDLSGSFPYAQLAKFSSLGLKDGISKERGQLITREDCMYLFYNLLTAQTKSGQVYGQTLGYTLNASGEIDYSALVKKNMKGPYVTENASLSLPFAGNMEVYRNGTVSSLNEIMPYDVYYYNSGMRTVWAFSNKVTGTFTNAAPSKTNPSSVTVAGTNYTLGTSSAAYKLSAMGEFAYGDTVTLLLGMDGSVADVISPDKLNATEYGVVISTGSTSYTDNLGLTQTSKSATVICADGIERTYNVTSTYEVGDLLKAVWTNGKLTVSKTSDKGISGKVNDAGTKIGNYALADDVQMIDVTESGIYTVVYPQRLKGASFTSSAFRYYELDENDKIAKIIFDDVTGDAYSYGVVTNAVEVSAGFNISSSYQYIIGGKAGAYQSNTSMLGAEAGPARFAVKNGAVTQIKNLEQITISSIEGTKAVGNGESVTIWGDVQVYIYDNKTYSQTNMSAVLGNDDYTVRGYVDNFGPSLGKLVRVIIAEKK
ncbi:MAG: S-layer homology domain-containing protein [Ruminococcaceae bacterium]|nr:S-layer homology domain-containing protein [Oscillospiraceae bacterium]